MKIDLGKIFVKTVGVAGIAAVGYDAYKRAKWQGKMDQKLACANMMQHFQSTTEMCDMNSSIRAGAKNNFNEWSHASGLKGTISGVIGFCKGFIAGLADNIVPLALATGAFMLKKGGKYCVWGLGLYAAKFLVTDLLGVGKHNYFPDTV